MGWVHMCRELVVCGRYVNATLKYGLDDAFEYTNIYCMSFALSLSHLCLPVDQSPQTFTGLIATDSIARQPNTSAIQRREKLHLCMEQHKPLESRYGEWDSMMVPQASSPD